MIREREGVSEFAFLSFEAISSRNAEDGGVTPGFQPSNASVELTF